MFTPWHKHNFLSLSSAQGFYWVSLTKRLFTRSHWQRDFYWVTLTKRLLLGLTDKETFYWVSLKNVFFIGSHWQRDFLPGLTDKETFYRDPLTKRLFTGTHWQRDFLQRKHPTVAFSAQRWLRVPQCQPYQTRVLPNLQDRLVQTLSHPLPTVTFWTYWLVSFFSWILSPYLFPP